MTRVNLIQKKRCGCGHGGHGPDLGILTGTSIIAWTFVLVPGLVLWAFPLAIATFALTSVLAAVAVAADWLLTRLTAA